MKTRDVSLGLVCALGVLIAALYLLGIVNIVRFLLFHLRP